MLCFFSFSFVFYYFSLLLNQHRQFRSTRGGDLLKLLLHNEILITITLYLQSNTTSTHNRKPSVKHLYGSSTSSIHPLNISVYKTTFRLLMNLLFELFAIACCLLIHRISTIEYHSM